MTGKSRKGKAVAQAKAQEPSAGPSSSFNMRINPPVKSKAEGAKKKNSPAKAAPPKPPGPGPKGKTKTAVKENKVPEVETDSDSDSSEEEIPVKLSVKVASKPSPAKVQKLSNDSNAKASPKSVPKSVALAKDDSSSDEYTSDESEPEKEVKSGSPKKSQVFADDSDSDEDDFKIPSASQKRTPTKPGTVGSHKKNLTHELDKVKVDESSDSDESDDTTYESTVEDEDEENGLDDPVEVAPKKVLKPAETDAEDIKEGSQILIKMSDDDVSTLLERLEAASPVLDKKSSKDRAKLIKWDDIAFENWDGESCRKAWHYLRQKKRVRRNLWEVVHEVKLILDKDVRKFRKDILETCPGHPVKPSGFQGGLNMYAHVKYTEKKEKNTGKINYIEWYGQTVKEYHALSDNEKKIWVDKSARAQAEYQDQLEKFYDSIGYRPEPKLSKKRSRSPTKVKLPKGRMADHPDAPVPPLSPMDLFIQTKLDKYDVPPEPDELEELKIKYGTKWHALDNSKKAKWIGKVIGNIEEYYTAVENYKETHEDFEEKPLKIGSGSLLTKAELTLWEATQRRPEKPPASHIDMLIEELEETGELDAKAAYDEKKIQAELKYNKMPWSDRERYKVNHRNQVVQYVTSIGQYFSALPEFLRPVLISTVDKKYRHEIAGCAGSDAGSPKKRKRHVPSSSSTTSTSGSTKSKKKKFEIENAKEIMADVEKIKNTLDSSPEVSKPKKKKKSATLNEIIRGIFDARQDLGRRYSVYYYYARSVAGNETWVTTLELLGILSTASLILKEFVQLPDHEKVTFINHSRNFHKERYYSLKTEPDETTMESDEESFIEFHCEPKFPPSTPEAFYTAEMRKFQSKSHPLWKDLPEKTKNTFTKKFYKATKQYVLDFERFVDQMSSNDMIEYAVSRLKRENWLLTKESSSPEFVNKDFIFPLPKPCLSDQEDFDTDRIISEEQRIKEQAEAWKLSELKPKSNGIFSNSTFLSSVADTLEKSQENASFQDMEERIIDSETDNDSSDSQSSVENLWSDTQILREAKKNAQRRNKAQLLYNLGDLTSVPFQEHLK